MTRILKHQSKYGEDVWDVTTDHNLGTACLNILENHEARGYYDPGAEPEAPDYEESSIQGMPRSLQESARRAWNEWRLKKKSWDSQNRFYQQVKTILQLDAEPAELADKALSLLSSRAYFDYECVQVEDLEPPTERVRSS